MSKIFLSKNWRFIEKENKIYFFNFVTSKQVEINEDKEMASSFLKGLQGGIEKSTLLKKLRNEFPDMSLKWFNDSIKALKKYYIIQNRKIRPSGLSLRYLAGLDRQLDFLDEMFPNEGGYKKQIELKKIKVAILGLGTISQYIILPLIASGVGNFKCVDFDLIEERNIGRQPIFRRNDIGKSKASVIKDFIKKSRFDIKAETKKKMLRGIDDVKEFIYGCDIVIHCCDYPRFVIHRWINEACLSLNIPNLLVYSGRVGPFSIPFKTSCYGCLETFLKQYVLIYDDFAEKIRKEGLGRYPELAVVGALTGTLAAKEIIAYILGIPVETYNAFFDINPRNVQIIKHPLPRQKKCYACSSKFKN
ncbi:MAG: ThiF family adenylyltransferase [Nanoarchaeota archaeon]|nr:ThiF family adenylyltransferase [Nanoarchaeota archaeon]